MAAAPNPIAEQSKQWMRDALLILMERTPYPSISITDICKQAGLARRTFYRNFSSKEDILYYHFCQLTEQYLDELQKQSSFSYDNLIQVFFRFWLKHESFLRKLQTNHLLFIALDAYNKQFPLVYDSLKREIIEYASLEELELALLFSAGGCWNILIHSLNTTNEKNPERLGQMAANIIRIAYERL